MIVVGVGLFGVIGIVVVVVVLIGLYSKIRGPGGIFQTFGNIARGAAESTSGMAPVMQARGILSKEGDDLQRAMDNLNGVQAQVNTYQRKVANDQADVDRLLARKERYIKEANKAGLTQALADLANKQKQLAADKAAFDSLNQQLADATKRLELARQAHRSKVSQLGTKEAELQAAQATAQADAIIQKAAATLDSTGATNDAFDKIDQAIDKAKAPSQMRERMGSTAVSDAEEDARINQADAAAEAERLIAEANATKPA